MSTHNVGFYEDFTKIIFELSSNTHLISSAVGRFADNMAHICHKVYMKKRGLKLP